MIWLLLVLLLLVFGFLVGKKCQERTPMAKNIFAAGAGVCSALMCLFTFISGMYFRYTPPFQYMLIFPFFLGALFGVAWAYDEAKAAEAAKAEEERQKRIANQQYSYCPVCGTELQAKQDGESGALGCSNCPWVKEGSAGRFPQQ